MGVGMGMVVRVSCHTSNGTYAEPNPPIEIRLAAVSGNERVAAGARGTWSAAAGRVAAGARAAGRRPPGAWSA